MNLNALPLLPGKVLARSMNGTLYYADATPELVNNQLRLVQDLQAAGQPKPKGDHATLADYLIATPDRTRASFYQWATREQVSPRKCMQLELEGNMVGLDLNAMTFQPGVSMSRKQQPVDDDSDDQESMTFHPGTTMADTF